MLAGRSLGRGFDTLWAAFAVSSLGTRLAEALKAADALAEQGVAGLVAAQKAAIGAAA